MKTTGVLLALLTAIAFSTPLVSGAGKGIPPVCFDSGTRVVREVAESLTGKGRSILECYPPGSWLFLWLLHLLPESLRIAGIEWGSSLSVGVPPSKIADFDVMSLPRWCLSQYPADHEYKAIAIGSPNGGVAHLAALLRAPFLTSSFVLTIRHPAMNPDDIETYYATGEKLAAEILAESGSTGFEVINHYDPLHDRSLVKYVNFLRIRLLEIPKTYQDFILQNLAPDGKIVLINCSYTWPQYTVGERSYLQVGGLGEISPREYLSRFALDLPIKERRESEWGCPEEFVCAVKEFAQRHGIDVIEINYDHPQEYSLLAYRAYLACTGARTDELLIDCFNYQNPLTNIQTGIPALWLPFNTEDSLAFARGFLAGKEFERIYLALLPSFARSPDTAPIEDWENLLSSHGELIPVGVDPHAFPADPLAPFRFVDGMKGLRERRRLSMALEISPTVLAELLSSDKAAPEPGLDRTGEWR